LHVSALFDSRHTIKLCSLTKLGYRVQMSMQLRTTRSQIGPYHSDSECWFRTFVKNAFLSSKVNIYRYANMNVNIQAGWHHTCPQVGKNFITMLWSPVMSASLDVYICMSIPVYIYFGNQVIINKNYPISTSISYEIEALKYSILSSGMSNLCRCFSYMWVTNAKLGIESKSHWIHLRAC